MERQNIWNNLIPLVKPKEMTFTYQYEPESWKKHLQPTCQKILILHSWCCSLLNGAAIYQVTGTHEPKWPTEHFRYQMTWSMKVQQHIKQKK